MASAEARRRVDERLTELYERHLGSDAAVAKFYDSGRGYYPPSEAGEEAGTFAIALVTPDGDIHTAGDAGTPFPLQSISKVFVYGLALADRGRDHVLQRVGVEPSGDPFNSIEFDQRNNRPYNPMVNAGAMVATDLVRGSDPGGPARAASSRCCACTRATRIWPWTPGRCATSGAGRTATGPPRTSCAART